MKLAPLMTHDIGSLAKPSWKLKAFADLPLNEKDLAEAERWGIRLEIVERAELEQLLSKKQGFTSQEKIQILRFASLYATRLLEKAGLDLVWDGEQHRIEMYEFPIRHMTGFVFRGHVRSFDNKYYYKASCVEPPNLPHPFHVEEYQQIASFAKKAVKIPITGAYTLMDWSFDEYYAAPIIPGSTRIREGCAGARREFLTDIAQRIVYPNLKALQECGAAFLQIDEPAATTKRDEIAEFIEATKISIGDLAGKVFFSMHICFSDYSRLFPSIRALEGQLNALHLEYANRDTWECGVTSTQRVGYEPIQMLQETSFSAGLGVLDVHTDRIESPQLIRDRILYACKILKDPTRLMIAPDCGLRTRTWEVAFEKLRNMVEGRNLALAQL